MKFNLPEVSDDLRERIITACENGELADYITSESETLVMTKPNIRDFFDDVYTCDDCGMLMNDDETCEVQGGDRLVCADCRDNYRSCDNCGYVEHEDNCEFSDSSTYCCEDCYNQCEDDDNEFWDAFKGDVAKNTAKSIKNRYFGVELETSNFKYEQCGALLDYFNGVEDGSINAVEMVSVKLIGDTGLKIISDAMKIANGVCGAKVDTKCGYHIHVDARDYTASAIKRLFEFSVNNYNLFKEVVPMSRRDNSYCQELQQITKTLKSDNAIEAVLEMTKPEFWNVGDDRKRYMCDQFKHDKYYIDRYKWINFGSYGRYGTVEIRLHNGTTDARKIINWAKLWVAIVDDIKSNRLSPKKYASMTELINALSYGKRDKAKLIKYYDSRKAQFMSEIAKAINVDLSFAGVN